VSNYRPVSLSSQVSTVIETILRDAIVSHLEASNLIHDSQHGFRKGRSCLTNLLVFLDKAATFVNEGHSADVIYLDFAKAFELIKSHTRPAITAKVGRSRNSGQIVRLDLIMAY